MLSEHNRELLFRYLKGTATPAQIAELEQAVGGAQELARMLDGAWDRLTAGMLASEVDAEPDGDAVSSDLPAEIRDWIWWEIADVAVEAQPRENGWFIACFEFETEQTATGIEDAVDELLVRLRHKCHRIEAGDEPSTQRTEWQRRFLEEHGGAEPWLQRFEWSLRSHVVALVREQPHGSGVLEIPASYRARPDRLAAADKDTPAELPTIVSQSSDGSLEVSLRWTEEGLVVHLRSPHPADDAPADLLVAYRLVDRETGGVAVEGWVPLRQGLLGASMTGQMALPALAEGYAAHDLLFCLTGWEALSEAHPDEIRRSIGRTMGSSRQGWSELEELHGDQLPDPVRGALRSAGR